MRTKFPYRGALRAMVRLLPVSRSRPLSDYRPRTKKTGASVAAGVRLECLSRRALRAIPLLLETRGVVRK